ncbi:acetyltransferase [Lactiplantibacillus pentosus]|uniref:acetyltransferase n=1 Tax=Lactiplantibacillus pentosus TaxID=1589 RepID=UPI002090E709|nr:acetyltransferase [Lactiplantibacillus pentosus]WMB63355.1 acetyltransferase [Lactiplantibacillus pentosus]
MGFYDILYELLGFFVTLPLLRVIAHHASITIQRYLFWAELVFIGMVPIVVFFTGLTTINIDPPLAITAGCFFALMGYWLSQADLLTRITREQLLAAVYGAGSPVFNPWHWQVQPIGAVWFLLSMFIAIQLFNGWMTLTARYAQRTRQDLARGVIVIALAISGGVLGQIAYLPWAFNAALLAQAFLYAGYLVRQTNLLQRMPAPWYLLLTFMWLLSAFQGYFALTVPVSPNLLISVMGGVAGSLCVIRFSEWLSQHASRRVVQGLQRYGQLSLVVLCFHLIDLDVIGLAGWVNGLVLPHGGPLIATVATIGYRIAFVTLAMWAIPHLPVLRACFLPRQYSFKWLQRREKQYVQFSKPRDDKMN